MSVRNKLLALSVLLAVLPLVTGIILFATSRRIQQAEKKANLAEEFEKEVFDLTLLTNEFTRFRSPRARRLLSERQARIPQLTARLKSAATNEDERRIVAHIEKHNQRFADLTGQLASSGSGYAEPAPFESRERWSTRLAGQSLVAAQAVLSDSRRLRKRCTSEVITAQRLADRLVFCTILLTALLGGAALVVLYRSIAPPLQHLADTVAEFGRGQRGVRVESQSGDEIGAVCRAFNKMASDLQQHHEQLEALVEERTAALASQQFLLNVLVENIPDPVFFKDREGRFIRVNQAMAQCAGLADPGQLLGKTDADIWSGGLPADTLRDEQQILASGEPLINKEEQPIAADGKPRWVLVTKMALRNETGEIVGTFGVAREITERKRHEQEIEQVNAELRKARDEAEKANRAKSQFLANMSHEIRTPLNAVIGITELVLDTSLSATQREYLAMVQASGESLLSVINDILDFSKIEAGKLDLERMAFDLRDDVGNTMKSLALRADAKGLELACHIAPSVPQYVEGDSFRLRQIIVNLVANAIKFTEAGEVVLEVQVESQADQRTILHFAVSDTGIGIPEDKLTRIYEAFEQAESGTTRRFGGTGLGLAISARLAELMGGRLWAESEEGRGSTFHFTAHFDLPAEVPEAKPKVPESLFGLRVLVVDDNQTNRQILTEILKNWQMEPTAVPDAEEALGELHGGREAGAPYQLVLTDVHMPVVDGFHLAEQIKKDDQLGSTVILMLTSGDGPGDIARCRDVGGAAYLIKPIKQSELFDAIVVSLGITELVDPAATSAEGAEQRPMPQLRILLAEDSYVNQRLAEGLLTKWGHDVTVVNNGREAVSEVESGSFDLVLMDIQMPEMDGYQATSLIRKREGPTGQHIPIVAMTAHAMKGDREECLAAGMDDYVSKPIRQLELRRVVEEIIAGGAVDMRPATAEDAPAPASPGTLDWNAVLESVGGDREVLQEVMAAVIEECPRYLDQVEQAIQKSDAALLRRAAHTVKGNLRFFGKTEAGDLAERLEEIGKSGCCEEAAELLVLLRHRTDVVLREVQTFVEH